MTLDNYLLYLEKTAEMCPEKVKKHLVKKFLEIGLACYKNNDISEQIFSDNLDMVDISEKTLTEQFVSCLRKSHKACLLYEKWEFEKDYKYSVVFSSSRFSDILCRLSQRKPLDNICENEYVSVSDSLAAPVVYHTDEYSFLKFNRVFAAYHPLTEEEFLLKYPLLVVFHKSGELIEFRFDVVKRIFVSGKKETTIYSDLVSAVREYIETDFGCELYPLDMDFMVNAGKNDSSVRLIAQYMKLPDGGNAQLEVGNNQEYVLPLIGGLRTILSDYQADLEKVPALHEALEQFMYEMEEMSDYPWIELLWENEIKTRSIHVKFIFNYMRNDYCLIQHYQSNVLIGMERMNYVIKYIVNHRNGDKKQTE